MNIESVSTLIGTNAAGKTNAIDRMMIMAEIVTARDLSGILDGTKNSDSIVRGGARGYCRFDSDYYVLGCTMDFFMQG